MAREPQYQIYDTIAFHPSWIGDNGWMTNIELGLPLARFGVSKRVTHLTGCYRAKRDFKGERPDDHVMLRFEITPEEISQELPHNQLVVISRRGAYLYNGNLTARGELREIWHETIGGLGHYGYERAAHRTLVWNNDSWSDPPMNNGLFLMMLRRHYKEMCTTINPTNVAENQHLKELARLEELGFRGSKAGKMAPAWFYGKLDVHSQVGQLWSTMAEMNKNLREYTQLPPERRPSDDPRLDPERLFPLIYLCLAHTVDVLTAAIAETSKEATA